VKCQSKAVDVNPRLDETKTKKCKLVFCEQ
jgi:hypothetical protein